MTITQVLNILQKIPETAIHPTVDKEQWRVISKEWR